jgi:hypothetical protein
MMLELAGLVYPGASASFAGYSTRSTEATRSPSDLRAARSRRGEEAYDREGPTAWTLVREHELRAVLIVMQAGSRIPDHVAKRDLSNTTSRRSEIALC